MTFNLTLRLSEGGRSGRAVRQEVGNKMLCSPVLLNYWVVRRVRVVDASALSLPVVG